MSYVSKPNIAQILFFEFLFVVLDTDKFIFQKFSEKGMKCLRAYLCILRQVKL